MTIFALTLTYNSKHLLEKLYPTLQAASDKIKNDLVWFIKDNASTDGTDELVKSWNNELFIRYFKHPNNLDNFAKGNNYLVDQVKLQEKVDPKKDYYLLLNNDITIEDSNSIRTMLNIMERDQDVGIVGSKLFYPGGKKLIQHFGVAMSIKHGNMPWHIYSRDYDSKFTQKDKMFQAVTGACLLIRCDCFDKLKNGKMDERYNWAFEDIDMCLQVNKNQNKKIVCCANTKIIHHESATLEKNPVNKMFMGNNVKIFKNNWQGKYVLDYLEYERDVNFNLYKA